MKTFRLIISFTLIFLISALLVAEERDDSKKSKKINLGIYTGYTNYKDLDSAIQFGISASKKFTENLAAELRTGYMSMSIDKEYDSIDKGDLKVMPLQLSLMYSFGKEKFKPYVLAGAGYYFVSFDNASKSAFSNLGFTIKDEMDNKFGFHAGAGLDYVINGKFTFNADIRYAFVNLGGKYTITDQTSGISRSGNYDGKLNNLAVTIGVKYTL